MKNDVWGNFWIALTLVVFVMAIKDAMVAQTPSGELWWSLFATGLAWGLLCRIDDKVKEWRSK